MFGFLTQLFVYNIPLAVIGLLGGMALLWLSSDTVIRGIGPIARYFHVREFVVTILGVSILSSLPELSVSAFAAAAGKAEISLGNVIGSNFVTLTFVTALCAMIRPIAIHTEIKERESAWMVLSTAVILLLSIDGRLTRLDGLILVVLYIPYLFGVIHQARLESKKEKKKAVMKKQSIGLPVVFVILGIFGILLGADLALKTGEYIGTAVGLSPVILGILLLGLGTSLPELSVALAATFKNKADVTIGEIYASNIFTALFVLGICAVISPMTLFPDPARPTMLVMHDIPMLILAGVVIQIFVTTGSKLVRLEAAFIVILYLYFVLSHFFPINIFYRAF